MYCTQLAVKVEKLGLTKNCEEGICLRLEKIEFITPMNLVTYDDCNLVEEGDDLDKKMVF